ncbi:MULTISPECIES: type II secretion system F family protein [unclassified Streptomyces]|uniref:type II secretion system F family protein n=1 Tax=unclassified Streptomyces TaxID=2593676 RepID=UPI00225AA1C8|nr:MULTISPECIES: type II secretion system F family protein [unclassified Streptomyces]MCX4527242.1 type II secretion system F family protein [Streptomyces sp. NBC_01551]MCX4542181.1 type II secretion system F family protein [Streptomyces sp. NBC_01565]
MTGFVVHRLGMALCLAMAVLCAGSAVAARIRERAARRRIGVLLAVFPVRRGPVLDRRIRGLARAWAWPAGALLAGWALVGGAVGVLIGCGAAFGAWRWARRARPPAGVDPREAERQLPFAADLLAACLAAGAGPVEAAEVVGESLGGPVGERLALAGAELRLGGEPGSAWGRLAEIPGARGLAECLERAARTGAPAAEPVSRMAAALREDRTRRAGARAQRAAVLVTAPVGLCFLPAFLAVGVAPVVIGMASGLLSNT